MKAYEYPDIVYLVMRFYNLPDSNHLQLYRSLQSDTWKDGDAYDLDQRFDSPLHNYPEEFQSDAFVRLMF
jgi:hypothetical protein